MVGDEEQMELSKPEVDAVIKLWKLRKGDVSINHFQIFSMFNCSSNVIFTILNVHDVICKYYVIIY